MWKRWSKSSTSLVIEHVGSDTRLDNRVIIMSTPEPRTTATDGLTLGDGHQHVAKGKKHREQEGIHPIKIHHNEGNQVTGQHQSPWQALGGLAPTVSAAPQGEPIPDDKNLKRISIVHSEAAQFDILTANISSSTAIISSSHTDMLSVPSAADASKKPRNRLSINFFGRSGTNSDDKVKQETNLAAAPKFSRADKEAFAYAVAIRNLSLPAATGHTSNNMVSRRADLKKIKDKMLDPTSAATIVNYLRRLPPSNDSTVPSIETVATLESKPTQLVSLSMTDEEADKLFSSRLRTSSKSRIAIVNGEGAAPVSMHNASLSSIFDTIKDLQLVSYLGTGGNFGFGDSVDDQPSAILSGSIPSSATLMTGLTEIAKAIFSLGYASDELPYPSHKDVHPPTDRTSVMTYIWGFEICIPHDSVIYLGKVDSVCQTLSRLLGAIAIVAPQAREISPFVNYAASAIDFEWKTVKAQDKGRGVICTGTWIIPVAVIPRPWDFNPAPPASQKPNEALSDTSAAEAGASTSTAVPPKSTSTPANGKEPTA